MFSCVLFSVLAYLCLSQSIPDPTSTIYVKQQLDWFNPQDNRTYSEQVLIYDGYYNSKNGVIFFYAGNEGPIDGFYYNTGFMFDIASQFNALIVFGEHRYYGESLPFGDESFNPTSNMEWLTIELAVADYANLLTELKGPNYYNVPDMPVIVFGGSYGGVLAAACRIHYPSVFTMALASSAPVPQTLDTVDPLEYFKLVTQDYDEVNSDCPDIVRQGYAELIEMGADSKNYISLSETFGLCTALESAYDVMYLELWARNGLLTMAQYDYPYAASFEGSLPAWPVNATCNLLLQNSDNPLEALALASGFYYNASSDYTLDCYNMTAEFVLCADQTGCGLGPAAIAWDYQMCTEIVYGVDTNNVTDMFPPRIWELGNLTAYCIEHYNVIPEPQWMQTWYPLDVGPATTKVIWSNGLLDPWHGGGYLEPPVNSVDQPVVIFPSGAHHLDLRSANSADPSTTTQGRQQEVNYFNQWLVEYYDDLETNGNYFSHQFQPKKIKPEQK